MTRQAMQLGWLPGMNILQTSADAYGQLYVPFVNWAMMLGTLALTLTFAHSDRLAGAYGAAVSATLLMTTVLLYRIMRVLWRWPTRRRGCGVRAIFHRRSRRSSAPIR